MLQNDMHQLLPLTDTHQWCQKYVRSKRDVAVLLNMCQARYCSLLHALYAAQYFVPNGYYCQYHTLMKIGNRQCSFKDAVSWQ